jgi:hypothetical protein
MYAKRYFIYHLGNILFNAASICSTQRFKGLIRLRNQPNRHWENRHERFQLYPSA